MLNAWPFLVSATGESVKVSRDTEEEEEERSSRMDPKAATPAAKRRALPARQRLRIQEQGQIATSGREGCG